MHTCVRCTAGLAVAFLAATTAVAQTQPLGFKKCSAPKVPIGLLRGSGELAFDLSTKGKPDTASIQVLAATGVSAPELRSAVGRQLSACQFNVHDVHLTGPTRVRQAWAFQGAQVRFGGAVISDSGTAIPTVDAIPMPSGPVADTSTALEEHPRELSCPSGASSIESPPSDAAAVPDPGALPAQSSEGTVQVEYTVDPTGRVPPGSIQLLGNTDLMATSGLTQEYARCRYAPGRIGGIPVATIVDQAIVLRSVTTIQTRTRSRH